MIEISFFGGDGEVFQVRRPTDLERAVKKTFLNVNGTMESLYCYLKCSDSLPFSWAKVPNLILSRNNDLSVYRSWPLIVDYSQQLEDLTEIVIEDKRSHGYGLLSQDEDIE